MTRHEIDTDRLRGLYPIDINSELAYRVGAAVASLAEPQGYVIVGQDTRPSSHDLINGISAGILSAGRVPLRLNVVPTPAVAHTAARERVPGAMITASHNDSRDNGIKLIGDDGHGLTGVVHSKFMTCFEQGWDQFESVSGPVDGARARRAYRNFVLGQAPAGIFIGKRYALDLAHGAAAGAIDGDGSPSFAIDIFESLGATVYPLFDTPDGAHINDKCGATNPKKLSEVVRELGLDGGVAFDGDGDRTTIVDSQGRELGGERLALSQVLRGQLSKLVTTVVSNGALEKALVEQGVEIFRTPVGDHHVLAEMLRRGVDIGIEPNGHLLRRYLIGAHGQSSILCDGMAAAVITMAQAVEADQSLTDLYDSLQLFPQATVNIQVGRHLDRRAILASPEVQQEIAKIETDPNGGRVVLRPSDTEPVIRAMVEGNRPRSRAYKLAGVIRLAAWRQAAA